MRSLIIGEGEVGKALFNVLIGVHEIEVFDINHGFHPSKSDRPYKIIHICFPYSENFIKYVKEYQTKYKPKYTVIHSTVPVGTSRQCNATHSPIRGIHPNLEDGIKTFVKFLGGNEASEIADYFRRAGIRVMLFDRQENSEALKLFDTEYYRICIEFAHRVKQYCIEHELSFSDIYRMGNITYNQGYTELGHPEFVRPILEPIMKPIGGHCVIPNKELIKMSEEKKDNRVIAMDVGKLMVSITDYESMIKQGYQMEAYYQDKDGKEHLINEHLKTGRIRHD